MYENMDPDGHTCVSCYQCTTGFLTDREHRKVWGVGILYLLGFPILSCMVLVGALKVGLL